MAAPNLTRPAVYVHPEDPAGWLAPDQPLFVGGYDIAEFYVVYRRVAGMSNYAVGTNGRSWSCNDNRSKAKLGRWRIVKGERHREGYIRVNLSDWGRSHRAMLHDLVLSTFVGPCPEGMQCRHLNGNPADNRLVNLCWGTPKENAEDKRRHGTLLLGSSVAASKLTEEVVAEIHALAASGKTNRELGRQFNINEACISRIVRRKQWAHIDGTEYSRSIAEADRRIGSMNRGAKITEEDVLEIRRLAANGNRLCDIALTYKIHRSTICRIVNRKNWSHI